jgi:hypothetical protein
MSVSEEGQAPIAELQRLQRPNERSDHQAHDEKPSVVQKVTKDTIQAYKHNYCEDRLGWHVTIRSLRGNDAGQVLSLPRSYLFTFVGLPILRSI